MKTYILDNETITIKHNIVIIYHTTTGQVLNHIKFKRWALKDFVNMIKQEGARVSR